MNWIGRLKDLRGIEVSGDFAEDQLRATGNSGAGSLQGGVSGQGL